MLRKLLVAISGLTLCASSIQAENWPQWRGPHGNGKSTETGLPISWSKTDNVAWRLELPGAAGATPAVWNDRVFVTSAGADGSSLIALSTDGRELWRRHLDDGNKDCRAGEGNAAAPSPITDGKHVWTFVGTGTLSCHDFSGELVWSKSLVKEFGAYDFWHCVSSSPLLVDDTIYHMRLQIENPFLVALDKTTGAVQWKVARESDALSESRHSYASPILYRNGQTELLLIHGADYTTAHRLSDGKEVWRTQTLNPKSGYNKFFRFVSSPATDGKHVVVPSAKNGPTICVTPDGKGGVTEKWRRAKNTTDVPTPVIHDGLLYLMREKQFLICIDVETGEEIYMKRIHGDLQRASPVIADGRLYIASRAGKVFTIALGREFKILGKSDIGEPLAATPAVAGGRIYLRTYRALWAIEKGAKVTSTR